MKLICAHETQRPTQKLHITVQTCRKNYQGCLRKHKNLQRHVQNTTSQGIITKFIIEARK